MAHERLELRPRRGAFVRPALVGAVAAAVAVVLLREALVGDWGWWIAVVPLAYVTVLKWSESLFSAAFRDSLIVLSADGVRKERGGSWFDLPWASVEAISRVGTRGMLGLRLHEGAAFACAGADPVFRRIIAAICLVPGSLLAVVISRNVRWLRLPFAGDREAMRLYRARLGFDILITPSEMDRAPAEVETVIRRLHASATGTPLPDPAPSAPPAHPPLADELPTIDIAPPPRRLRIAIGFVIIGIVTMVAILLIVGALLGADDLRPGAMFGLALLIAIMLVQVVGSMRRSRVTWRISPEGMQTGAVVGTDVIPWSEFGCARVWGIWPARIVRLDPSTVALARSPGALTTRTRSGSAIVYGVLKRDGTVFIRSDAIDRPVRDFARLLQTYIDRYGNEPAANAPPSP